MNGATALFIAAQKGHAAAVEALLSAGASTEVAGKDGSTQLIWAAWNGHTAVVEALRKAGANMEAAIVNGAVGCT